MRLRGVDELPDLHGRRVLLRLALNVPVKDGHVADDFRLGKVMPTLKYLKDRGGRIVIVSHIESEGAHSLLPVFHYLKEHLPLRFIDSPIGPTVSRLLEAMRDGNVVLLENLRTHPGEKANDPSFAKLLASLGDYYVNEDFPVSHRAHASVVGIPKHIPGYAGLRFVEEVERLSEAWSAPKPFVLVLGGAKTETKIPLLRKFLEIADVIFPAGIVAHDCLRARGFGIGASPYTEKPLPLERILESDKLMFPRDALVTDGLHTRARLVAEIAPNDKIVDVGPESLRALEEKLRSAAFVLWNGPLGFYEAGHRDGTLELARAIARIGVSAIVGGGDTIAAIRSLGIEDKFRFVSTGGGAMLDYLAEGTLPGIEALKDSPR